MLLFRQDPSDTFLDPIDSERYQSGELLAPADLAAIFFSVATLGDAKPTAENAENAVDEGERSLCIILVS